MRPMPSCRFRKREGLCPTAWRLHWLGRSTRMANSPPPIPVQKRRDEELLDDLGIELRHVGVGDHDLPSGHRILPHIREVVTIHAELVRRGVDWRPRLDVLSAETKWQMLP